LPRNIRTNWLTSTIVSAGKLARCVHQISGACLVEAVRLSRVEKNGVENPDFVTSPHGQPWIASRVH
jgi:hypothetical protein